MLRNGICRAYGNAAVDLAAIAECYLHDVFLMMSIASPGSCSFYSLSAIPKPTRAFHDELSLSDHSFEAADLWGREGKWPAPSQVPLKAVRDWYYGNRTDFAQVPHNRMEKVLFALLHIAKIELSPTTIVWLFYALESLYDTKPGENYRSLLNRISSLLCPSDREEKLLRKNLRKLYDLRSSIVHGGFQVVHPLRDDYLDSGVQDEFEQILGPCDFGFSVIIASLQELIRREWDEPSFHEVITNHKRGRASA
jgi:hypothetical protein